MRQITETQAKLFGSLAPPTPLVMQIPLRGGKFIAEIRIPLDVTEGELGFISKTVMRQPAQKDSWRLEPHEYISESPPCEALHRQTISAKDDIARDRAR
jgi:hypothetical protein